MVKHVEEDHMLQEVFEKFPDIAFSWIAFLLEGIRTGQRAFYFGLRYDHATAAATAALNKEQRRALIGMLSRSSAVSELAQHLVMGEPDLFAYLLSLENLGVDIRLAPLRIDNHFDSENESNAREFGAAWNCMAVMALDHGFSENDILFASQAGGGSWSGPMSAMYASRLAPFEKLSHHSDPRLRKIGDIGVTHFSKARDESLERERRAAIRGEPY